MAMKDWDRVLIDTSAWIDFFRGKEPCRGAILRLMEEEGRFCCVGLVLAELMQGAKSDKELAVIEDFIHVFDFLPESPELWEKAGRLAYRLRRAGKTVGLSDCCIAVASARAKASLLMLDGHFAPMEKEAGIRLVRLSTS